MDDNGNEYQKRRISFKEPANEGRDPRLVQSRVRL